MHRITQECWHITVYDRRCNKNHHKLAFLKMIDEHFYKLIPSDAKNSQQVFPVEKNVNSIHCKAKITKHAAVLVFTYFHLTKNRVTIFPLETIVPSFLHVTCVNLKSVRLSWKKINYNVIQHYFELITIITCWISHVNEINMWYSTIQIHIF